MIHADDASRARNSRLRILVRDVADRRGQIRKSESRTASQSVDDRVEIIDLDSDVPETRRTIAAPPERV
jgi:hypothetical protein